MASPKDPQQFCVRWNSYQSNLQSAFPKLLTNEHFVDVTLACESRMVKCHKVVLSACSAYFEKLLVQNPCQHPIIFMKDMKYWEVQALVDFMYKGEVNVTQDELASLLKAAEALEVRGLCGQQDGQGNKLLPRGTEAAAKKRRADENVGGKGDSATPSAGNGGGPAPPTTPVLPSQFGGGDTNGAGDGGSVGQAQSLSNPDGNGSSATEQSSADPAATGATPTSTPSDVKQECMATPDNGLFEDFDDDFYQDDNSLQIDETGNAYSLTTPNVQLDCSPTDNRPSSSNSGNNMWNMNNGYPNVILTETCSPQYSMPSPSNEAPGKIQRIRRSDAELLSAADSICKGMTFQKASQTFNIPMSTIRFYMARKGMLPSRRRGRRISQGMDQSMQQPSSQSLGGPSSAGSQPMHHQSGPIGYSQMPSMLQNHYFKTEPTGY